MNSRNSNIFYSSISFAIALLFSPLAFSQPTDQITVTSYYPSPFGVYSNLKLIPTSTAAACSTAGDEGVMYYDLTTHNLRICTTPGTTPEWSELWTLNGNNLYPADTETNSNLKIGIGTTTPGTKLHLYGQDHPIVLKLESTWGFGAGKIEFWSDGGLTNNWRPGSVISTDNGSFTGGLAFMTNGTGSANKTTENEVMRIVNGKVGIGTTAPQNKLDVEGGAVIGATYSGTNTAPANGLLIQGSVGIGTVTPADKLEVVGGIISSQNGGATYNSGLLDLTDSGNGKIWEVTNRGANDVGNRNKLIYYFFDGAAWSPPVLALDTLGRVGIGTTNPNSTLQINGAISRQGTTLNGANSSTHVNLGNNSTTGASGFNYSYTTVGGGNNNLSGNDYTTVGGGDSNNASGPYDVVAGGRSNGGVGSYASVLGGFSNSAAANYATVGGGTLNTSQGSSSTVGGGNSNTASGSGSTIAGGAFNSVAGDYASVLGGIYNSAAQNYSTAIGNYMTVSGGYSVGINLAPIPTAYTLAQSSTLAIMGGKVGIGTLTPSYQLQLSMDSAYKPGTGAWTFSSDARLKKNIEPLRGALDKILKLRGVTYQWIEPGKQGNMTGTYMGLIAQDVEKVFPEWVGVGKDGYKTLTIGGFEALAAEAIREQQKQIDFQRKEIDTLKEEIKELRAAKK